MDERLIDEHVLAAQDGNVESRELLLAAGKERLAGMAAQISGRRLDWSNDDELSIALLAFNDAIDSFQPSRAVPFWGYVKVLVRHRLFDYFRREAKHNHESFLSPGEPGVVTGEFKNAWERYVDGESERDRIEELTEYSRCLNDYGLTLEDLAAASPKHRDTKATLIGVAQAVAEREELAARLLTNKQLPIKELMAITGVSRKVLETGRRYIIAVALLLLNEEFIYLRSFVKLPSERRCVG